MAMLDRPVFPLTPLAPNVGDRGPNVGDREELSSERPSGARLVLRPESAPDAEQVSSLTRFHRHRDSGMGFAPAAKDGPRLLLVDSDPESVAQLLHPFADVTAANSTEAALAIIESGHVFDAVVSDLTLGGMSGITFFAYLSAMHPYLASRFIAISSAPPSELDETFKESIGNRLLMKPVAVDEMLLLLREISTPPSLMAMERCLSEPPMKPIAKASEPSPASAVVATSKARRVGG